MCALLIGWLCQAYFTSIPCTHYFHLSQQCSPSRTTVLGLVSNKSAGAFVTHILRDSLFGTSLYRRLYRYVEDSHGEVRLYFATTLLRIEGNAPPRCKCASDMNSGGGRQRRLVTLMLPFIAAKYTYKKPNKFLVSTRTIFRVLWLANLIDLENFRDDDSL